RSHSGEENHDLESALSEFSGEVQRLGIIFPRHFLHRGRHDGLAAIVRDQLGHLLRTPAFKTQNAQPSQPISLRVIRHSASPSEVVDNPRHCNATDGPITPKTPPSFSRKYSF